jgi:hypothetical protein
MLAEFDASGESAAAFARARGIPTWKIYHALSRRSGKARPRGGAAKAAQPALVPVRVVESAPTSSPAPLELVLAGGHLLRIGADFDAELLRKLLGALARC